MFHKEWGKIIAGGETTQGKAQRRFIYTPFIPVIPLLKMTGKAGMEKALFYGLTGSLCPFYDPVKSELNEIYVTAAGTARG